VKGDEKRLATQALAALAREWWKDATPSESESVIPLAYDSGISAENAVAANFVRESKVAEVRQRIALRRRLNLPNLDCTAPRRRWFAVATS
jgi:hypothetical protein